MVDLDKERKSFNKWFSEKFTEDKTSLMKNGNYSCWYKQLHWGVWLQCAKVKQTEVDTLKEKLTKIKSESIICYLDENENMYTDDTTFLSELNYGEVLEVERQKWQRIDSQYATNVYNGEGDITCELFDSEDEAKQAAKHHKEMIVVVQE